MAKGKRTYMSCISSESKIMGYITNIQKKNLAAGEKLELRKYDKKLRKHVIFKLKETKHQDAFVILDLFQDLSILLKIPEQSGIFNNIIIPFIALKMEDIIRIVAQSIILINLVEQLLDMMRYGGQEYFVYQVQLSDQRVFIVKARYQLRFRELIT